MENDMPTAARRSGRGGVRPGAGRPRGIKNDASPEAVARRAATKARRMAKRAARGMTKPVKPPGPGRGGARPGSGRKPTWMSPRALETKATRLMAEATRLLTRAAELRHGDTSPHTSARPVRASVTGATATD